MNWVEVQIEVAKSIINARIDEKCYQHKVAIKNLLLKELGNLELMVSSAKRSLGQYRRYRTA
jgi:hypothetical protein